MNLLALLVHFTDRKDRRPISQPFHILQPVKSLLFHIPKPEKGTPLGRRLPVWAFIGRKSPLRCLILVCQVALNCSALCRVVIMLLAYGRKVADFTNSS